MTTCYPDPWLAIRSTDREHGIYGSSRQEALTKWCEKWSPDWTPPIIHDEAWALRYMLEHCMSFGKASVWSAGEMTKDVYHDGTIEGIVKAVHQWKLIYAPDKPTREETVRDTELRSAVELLTKVHTRLFSRGISPELFSEVAAFLKEADHD
jgi:inhibitor of KinA sporulation pathway (predicted exonuclease)